MGEEEEEKKKNIHANQINDNLCMYIYTCLSHHIFVYIKKNSFARFLRYTQSISHSLLNDLHICR